MIKGRRLIALFVAVVLLFGGCTARKPDDTVASIRITNGERLKVEVGNTLQLLTDAPASALDDLRWETSNDGVSVEPSGLLTATEEGKTAVTVILGDLRYTILVEVVTRSTAYDDAEKAAFYADYAPADSAEEAQRRSRLGLMSGLLTVPDQAPEPSDYLPEADGLRIRNEVALYEGTDTYVVVDAYGEEVFRVYRGGAYITLEEVAAYVYAFGDVPANYVSGKTAEPEGSIWGEYLRLNHSAFSGNTDKYPYEPVLPNISGCGGELYYYEIDVGTTGTDCDPAYVARIYNDGETITRGAARIVYTRYDKNRNQILEPDERFVFYTYNHYNDFQEYLNYYGGWGEIFGNVTGGGKISSKTDYNPTPYRPTAWGSLTPAGSRTLLLPTVSFWPVEGEILLSAA